MITGKDIYDVLSAVVPLYVAMILAYGSVRWWHIFTPNQCSGINRFVAVFAVPLLSFHFISTNNPYAMNYRFIAADSLQKLVILLALSLWHIILSRRRNTTSPLTLDWTITLFSLSSLPNTLVMGIPLLKAMYGDFSGSLMVQIVVLQSVVWYTLMLLLFEYRGAKALIADQFPPGAAASIASFHVDSDVVSLNGRDPLQADAEVGKDGKIHVVLRRSAAPSTARSIATSMHGSPRASNLTGVEIYSLQSSREPTPRGSSFNQADFYAMFASKVTSPRFGRHKGEGSKSSDFMMPTSSSPYPAPSPVFGGGGLVTASGKKEAGGGGPTTPRAASGNPSKELHMFVWSSSASPTSEANLRNAVNRAASVDSGPVDSSSKVASFRQNSAASKGMHVSSENVSPVWKAGGKGEVEMEDGVKSPIQVVAGSSPFLAQKKVVETVEVGGGMGEVSHQMPPASVVTRLILIMVWRKLIRNPNTYSSLLGLIWSFVSFRLEIQMPKIIEGSIAILSDAGLGMAMFSLGLFMALQPKLIACGKSVATFAMAVRFLTGPAVIAATSIAIGLRGVLLHVAIVQAALPQGIVPFVFAKEYNCHPDILSTGVIFGMLIALPITILYYIFLGI